MWRSDVDITGELNHNLRLAAPPDDVLGLDRESDRSFSLYCFGRDCTFDLHIASDWGECHIRLDLCDFEAIRCVKVNSYRVSRLLVIRLLKLGNPDNGYFVILSVNAAGTYRERILSRVDDQGLEGVCCFGGICGWILFELSEKSEHLLC